MAKKQRRRVALLIETSNAYARGLLQGIRRFMRQHQVWKIYLGEQHRGGPAPKWLAKWDGDGIIARIENQRIAETILATKIPAIDLSAARLVPGVPYVETDDAAIAVAAAEHLLDRGFRQFGFCGVPEFMWSNNRYEAFRKHIEQAGYPCSCHPDASRKSSAKSWEKEQEEIGKWIAKLPKPLGLFAAYDIRGRQVLDACRDLAIAVPDEVAVLGVDNDSLVCDLADPPLSSVIPDALRTGFEAAQLLERMMSGEHVPAEAHLIKPLGIETRQSTDVLATDDPDVSMAIRFIREHACDGIRVADVLEQVPISRRMLELRFKEVLARTPHDEIARVQTERVKQLLLEADLTLPAIARLAGFKHPEYMSVAFKRAVGESPGAYRAQRLHG